MNFFKRALLSVTRRKGKSLILFAVIFILGNVIAGAIAIDQGTDNVEEDIKKKIGATATVTIDQDKLEKYANEHNGEFPSEEIKDPSVKTLEKISQLAYVKYYDYNHRNIAQTEKIKRVKVNRANDDSMISGMSDMENYVSFQGVNYAPLLDIKTKKISLADGRVFSDQEVSDGKAVAVVSTSFAKENSLAIGDKVVIDSQIVSYNEGGEPEDKSTFDFPLEIIGLFDVNKVEKTSKETDRKKREMFGMDAETEMEEKLNTIYLPNKQVSNYGKEYFQRDFDKNPHHYEMLNKDGTNMSKDEIISFYTSDEMNIGTPVYMLKRPEDAEAFRKEAQAVLDNQYYKILVSTDQYDSIAGPMKGMSKIAKMVLVIAVLASIMIITLVVVLFLRDRRPELGIYLSLGEKRGKVIGQIVAEVMLIAVAAITISVFTGNLLAKSTSNTLIQTQKSEAASNTSPADDYYTLSQISTVTYGEEDVIASYKISLSPSYIVLFYIVGLGVILMSTIVPLIYIVRLNPKKIMM